MQDQPNVVYRAVESQRYITNSSSIGWGVSWGTCRHEYVLTQAGEPHRGYDDYRCRICGSTMSIGAGRMPQADYDQIEGPPRPPYITRMSSEGPGDGSTGVWRGWPAWDAQLPEVVRRFPDAQVIHTDDDREPVILHVPEYRLGTYFSKPTTRLWMPLPHYFPIMPTELFGSHQFRVYVDDDLRSAAGGAPGRIVEFGHRIMREKAVCWRGWLHTWNQYRDGLYTLLMVVHQVLSKRRAE